MYPEIIVEVKIQAPSSVKFKQTQSGISTQATSMLTLGPPANLCYWLILPKQHHVCLFHNADQHMRFTDITQSYIGPLAK